MTDMLTLALSKGRLLPETLPLLSAIGCAPTTAPDASRALILPTENAEVRLLIVRAQDAPVYVARGTADAGIVGGDVLAENPYNTLYHPLTLNIGKCRLITASRKDAPPERNGTQPTSEARRLTVATKYVNLARDYYNRQGIRANIIKLNGNVELAPLIGLADAIVDLADTGSTLRANGLVETALIRDISAVFITNRTATRCNPHLSDLQARLEKVITHD